MDAEKKDNAIHMVYVGYNVETLDLLYNNFLIKGVADIYLFHNFTINPANLVFKITYFLRYKRTFRFLEIFSYYLWLLIKSIASPVFKKYAIFLEIIVKNKISVINFDNKEEVLNFISKNNIDIILVNTWEMLPEEIVSAPRLGTVNIHPSILPKYKGALPELWVLKNHEKQSAVTYMILNKGMDQGNIIKQHFFEITNEDDWNSILEKEIFIIRQTLITDLKQFISGKLKPYIQNQSEGSTTGKYEEYKKIDWINENPIDIYNKINFYPKDIVQNYCYMVYNNKRIYVKNATILKIDKETEKKGFSNIYISNFRLCVQYDKFIIKVCLFKDISLFSSLIILLDKKNIQYGL
jgi:methionyl-tRNA formyltransferase